MKILYRLCFFILVLMLFAACEKVITLDVPEGTEKIVIEGNIFNAKNAFVKVSRSLPYGEVLGDHYIDNADLELTVNGERKEVLKSLGEGYYSSKKIFGEIGSTYHLKVTVDGSIYTAVSTMPDLVPIDSMYYTYDPFPEVFDTPGDYRVDIDFKDPALIENSYRLKGYVNRELLNTSDAFMVFDDKLFDGLDFTFGLMGTRFNLNDTVTYELLSIDKPTYSYLSQLRDIMGGNQGGGGIPYNPEGNFSGGALGYFSAQSMARESIIINEE